MSEGGRTGGDGVGRERDGREGRERGGAKGGEGEERERGRKGEGGSVWREGGRAPWAYMLLRSSVCTHPRGRGTSTMHAREVRAVLMELEDGHPHSFRSVKK